MKTCIDSSERRFLERLHELREGTIQSICAELGVTATAVRHRLGRLQDLGLVTRETVRMGRGRPHHTYRVSESGLRMLGDNYVDLAVTLWSAIQEIEEPALRAGLLDRVEGAFARRYGRGIAGAGLVDRMEGLRAALVERGFDVELVLTGELPVLRENNCPYLDLAAQNHEICELEQAVFRRVLGAEVRLTQCCLDGHSCCEFQAVSAPGASTAASTSGG